nr:hypothetical protein [Acidobacteriota bacterium]
MIDKVHLRQAYASPPPERELRKFERTRSGSLVFNEPKPNGLKLKLPTLIYRPAKDGKHYLTVSVSLPKMLHGDNVRTLCDEEVRHALEKLTLFASSRSGLEFNAPTVPVSLVEFGALSHVGEENVPHYLTAV